MVMALVFIYLVIGLGVGLQFNESNGKPMVCWTFGIFWPLLFGLMIGGVASRVIRETEEARSPGKPSQFFNDSPKASDANLPL